MAATGLRRYARRCATWLGMPGTGAADVLEGRDGRLFILNDTNDVMAQITGRLKAGRRQLAAIAAVHDERERFCRAHGISYRHVICPSKESIETDKLPPAYAYEAHGPSFVAQYIAAEPAIRPFYDRSCLVGRDDAYYRSDSHWTEVGAVAYLTKSLRHWGDRRALDVLDGLAAEVAPVVVPTDLGSKLDLGPETSVGLHLPNEAATVLVQTELVNKGHVCWQRSSSPDVAGTRALVLHDSFGVYLFRVLGELYAETLFIHDHDFDPAFLLRYRPDVVWLLQAERFLPRIPRNGVDFVAMIERNERRKKAPANGSRFLRETWPHQPKLM